MRHARLAVGLAALLSSVMTLSRAEDAASLPDPVRVALESGEPDQARRLAEERLRQAPGDTEARRLLARALMDLGQGRAALAALQPLTGGQAPYALPADLQADLGRALLMSGQLQRVPGAIDPNSAGEDTALAAELEALVAEARLGLGEPAAARERFGAARRLDPANTRTLFGLALLAFSDGDAPGAERLLDEGLAADPRSRPGWELRGELAQLRADPEAAESSYTRALDIAPQAWSARFKRVTLRLGRGDFRGAADDLAAVRAANPGFPGVDLAEGWLALERGDLPTAWTHLEAYRRANPGDAQGAYLASLTLLRLGRYAESARALRHYRAARPRDPAGAVLGGELALAQGRTADAVALAVPLEGPQASVQALDLLWRALAADGQRDRALAVLRRLTEASPERTEYILALAASLTAAGDPAGARSVLDGRLARRPDDLQVQIARTRVALKDGDAGAADRARALAAQHPDRSEVHALLGQVLEAADDRAGARSAWERALALRPDAADAATALARLGLQGQDPEGARRVLAGLVAGDARNAPALLALARLDADAGNPAGSLARVRAALAADPADLTLRLGLAGLLAGPLGDPGGARSVLAAAPPGQSARPDLLRALGLLELGAGEAPAARARFERLATIAPEDPDVRWLVVLARARSGGPGGPEGFAEVLRPALTLDPRHPLARSGIDGVFTALPSPEARALLAVRLAGVAPDQPDLAYQRGLLASARADHAEAVRFFTLASTGAADERRYRWALIGALRSAGETAAAITSAQDWTRAHPGDTETRFRLAALLVEADRRGEARSELQTVLGLDPRHTGALNDLAMLLLEIDPKEALALAERAAASAPGVPAVADTLAAARRATGGRAHPADGPPAAAR